MVHGDLKFLKNKNKDLNSLSELSLHNNRLTSLDANIFNGLNNLKNLYLINNQLTSLDPNIFNGLNNLTELRLSRNKLTSLDQKIFNGLNNLRELWLNDNKLTLLDQKIFNDLNNLNELLLSDNKLTSLDPIIFNGLNNLRELWLNDNQLTSLDLNIFNSLEKLKKLYLNSNNFAYFTPNTFLPLQNVKCIWLYKNNTSFFSFYDPNLEDDYFDKNQKFKTNFAEFNETITKDSVYPDPVKEKVDQVGIKKSEKDLLSEENLIPKAVYRSNPFIGKTFNNYKIEKCIGTGFFASVFSCLDLNDNSTKAIKIYTTFNDNYIEDIDRLKKIKSEFIIEYFTQFQHDLLNLIIFEFAENGDLQQLIEHHRQNDKSIDPSKIFHWTVQATQGLQMLHVNKIIHRDIKPENIFLSKDHKIKLGDLGIAKKLDFEINSGKFTIIGTPNYMSPEILKCEAYSFNTDIWSLGCVVYELLFLKPAFSAFEKNVENLDFNDSILTGITKKMLTEDRVKRPTSEELYQHLMKLKRIFLGNDDD